MKKLLIALFGVLMLMGCAHSTYKIDPVATANAPWEIGEVILERPFIIDNKPAPVHRVFLGMTSEGYYVVQEFYTLTDTKRTEPFVLMDRFDVNGLLGVYDTPGNWRISSQYVAYHPNGQKMIELFSKDGVFYGMSAAWHENGQVRMSGEVKGYANVGIWREWDEEGNLIEETDYGLPQN